MTTRIGLTLFLSLSVLCLSGCGGGTVKATGKVVRDGQPFQLGERGMFIMSFAPESEPTMTYAVETKADGTFTVVGPNRLGVPAGKYKVAVQAMDPYDKGVDKLKGKYAQGKSDLVVEVKNAKEEIVVDVGK